MGDGRGVNVGVGEAAITIFVGGLHGSGFEDVSAGFKIDAHPGRGPAETLRVSVNSAVDQDQSPLFVVQGSVMPVSFHRAGVSLNVKLQ